MNQQTMQTGGAIEQMLRSHPKQSFPDQSRLAQATLALNECASTCTVCADACLSEQMVAQLVPCIRANRMCAEICAATACVLLGSDAEPQRSVLQPLLEACAAACQSCGQECARHADMHEHCRICAEACRRCEQACRQIMSSF